MDAINAIPAFWKTSGAAQRLVVSALKSITLGPNEHGVWIQTHGQNVYVTMDGSTPVIGGNDLGFEIRTTDAPVRLEGAPGTKFSFMPVTGTAIIQYQMLTLSGRN